MNRPYEIPDGPGPAGFWCGECPECRRRTHFLTGPGRPCVPCEVRLGFEETRRKYGPTTVHGAR